jgi:putative SOS response-associated peptidase YedK
MRYSLLKSILMYRWGLIPWWTKRAPDFASIARTINCRDDSLLENRGMWNSIKGKRRCIIPVMGYYEWLKKSPKEKIPHFTKRADGKIMLLAGLWDSVQYEGAKYPRIGIDNRN